MLLFEGNYKGSDRSSFIDKLNNVAFKLGANPNWFMYAFNGESGLNPAAVNYVYTFSDGGHAAGINQMIPSTLRGLGYTGDWRSYSQLSGAEQLDWVYKYFKPYAGQIKSYQDLYLANFYPAFLGREPGAAFPYSVVKANKGFDINGDGNLTLGEFYQYLDNKAKRDVPANYLGEFIDPSGAPVEWGFIKTHERDIILTGIVVAMIGFIFFITYLLTRR